MVIPYTFPKSLRPGDCIAVIAPSSGIDPVLGWRGLGFLSERYRLRFDRGLFSRKGYLAGSDERRRSELLGALHDPRVRAIVAARGGYGASRIVRPSDMDILRRDPKWIVGFSDITALHVEAARLNIASIHACHLTALGRGDALQRQAWVEALEAPEKLRKWEGLSVIAQGNGTGEVTGVLTGGNLTLLHSAAAAGRLSLPSGAVLFLEDVTEKPYRIDRMLTTLTQGGAMDGVRAVLFGDFTDCDPGPDQVTVHQVLREWGTSHGIPVLAGLQSGHGLVNHPLVLGSVAQVDARHGTVCFSRGKPYGT